MVLVDVVVGMLIKMDYTLFETLERSISSVELCSPDEVCDDIVKIKYMVKCLNGLLGLREKHLAEKTKENDTDFESHSIKFKSSNLFDKVKAKEHWKSLGEVEKKIFVKVELDYTKLKDSLKLSLTPHDYTRQFTSKSKPRAEIKKMIEVKK